jgi:4-carboxymuconolactone decarboxylase
VVDVVARGGEATPPPHPLSCLLSGTVRARPVRSRQRDWREVHMNQRIQMGAIVVREGRLMLIRSQIGAPWELPGGWLAEHQQDVDETMDAILTELGINSPAIEDDFLETVYIPEAGGQIVYNLYAASEWTGEPLAPAGVGLGWFALDELEAVAMEDVVRNAVLVAFGIREPVQHRIPFLEEPEPAVALEPSPSAALDTNDVDVLAPNPSASAAEALAPNTTNAGQPLEAEISVASEPQTEAPPATIAPTQIIGEFDVPAPPAPPQHRPPARVLGLDVLRTLSGGDPGPAVERMRNAYPELADDIVDFALGGVWSDETLARRERSLLVVAMLAALGGKSGPLRSHINGALNHGAKSEEIVATLRMVAVYAGFPAALEAWPIMEAVFEQRGIERPGRLR